MRVSEKQRFLLSQTRINQHRTRQIDLSAQLSSGKKLLKPSDDSLGAKKLAALTSEHRRVEQHGRNIDSARHLLSTTDHTLNESSSTLYRAKELAIRGLNSAMTPADRDFLADEIASLRDHLQSLANTRTNNRYIFGGYASTTPPYDNAFAFVGDTNATRFEVGDGELIQATTPGGAAFGDGTAATVDVFDNLNLLEAAVRVGSEVDMQNELERLETSVEQVITTRQRIGLQINRLDGAETVASYLNTRLPETMAELSDVDFTAAVTELKMVENALQATIATSSRLMKGTSLLDYI
jgi:flagellar hook-associated protein 3 FlgL